MDQCNKIGYDSIDDVEAAIIRNKGKFNCKTQTYYWCQQHIAYHITTNKTEGSKKSEKRKNKSEFIIKERIEKEATEKFWKNRIKNHE